MCLTHSANSCFIVDQVNNGVLDVMAVGVIRAFIEKDYNKMIDREFLKRNMKKELMEKVLERERFFFGALQRLDKPIQAIDKFIVNRQIEYGGQGNTWVMHWRTQEWLDLGVPRYNEYVKGGDEANDYLLDRTDSFLQFGNGQRVYILRTLNVDNRGEFDILKEIAVYGEWVLAFDHTRTLLPADQYESKWRSIQIYDANEDEWAVINLEDLIRNSGRWDERTGELINMGFFGDTQGKKDSLHVKDSVSGNLRPIKTFGEISTSAFSANAIDHLAGSVVRSVQKTGSLASNMTFEQAASVVRDYARRALDVQFDDVLISYLEALSAANQQKADASQFNSVASVKLTNNSLVLPAQANVADKFDVPPMLIHYGAMRAYVNSGLTNGGNFKQQVRDALLVLDGFVGAAAAATSLMGEIKNEIYPTYLPSQNKAMEMLVKNIQGRDYLPAWLRKVRPQGDNPTNVTNPATQAVVAQVVGLAAQAREQVENRLTGKFATIAASGGAEQATTMIAARLDGAAGGTTESLRLVSVAENQPAWGKQNLRVVGPRNNLDTGNATDLGKFVMKVIHNIGKMEITAANIDRVISTEAAKALILAAIGSVDPNNNTDAGINAIKDVVDGVKPIPDAEQVASFSDADVQTLFKGLTALNTVDRVKNMLRAVMRNYTTAKEDLSQVIQERGANARNAPAAATATSGYLRTPLMISPSLFESMVNFIKGTPATAIPTIMPADPMNPAQIMPNLNYYAKQENRPSILKEGESGVTLGAFQASRERVMNGGSNADRDAEDSMKTAENTLNEVVKTVRDPLKLGVALQYLTAKPTLWNVISMIKQNIVIPFSFMIQRPAISWFTYGGLKVQAGEQTAVTWFKSPVWSWQDDGVLQVYRAVLTYYSKTTVLQPKNVYMARHLLLDEYLGGMGVEFYKGGRTNRNTNLMSDKRNKHRPSILVSVEPYETTPKSYDKLISVRGFYPNTYQYLSKNGSFHYHNADWVMAYYGLTTAAQMGAQDEESATAQPLSDAMMMWRGMARYPLPSNSGVLEYRAVSMPQGYFPDTIYGPGMRKTWDDPFTPYRHYDYSGNGYVGLAV